MAYRKVVRKLVGLLDRMGIAHAVAGALAVGYYGLPRSTRDVDILVSPDRARLKKFVARAKKSGFTLVGRVESIETKNFTLEAKEGYRGDFWVAGGWHENRALERRRKKRFFGAEVWVLTPEDLILQKLWVGRPRDILDVVGVMVRQEGKLDLEYLRSSAEELGVADTFNWLARKVW
jgi:hypothetical protein